MYTGYYISSGSIYGPNGYTNSWIDGDSIYSTGGGYSQFYIDNGSIYKVEAGCINFYIDGDSIYGPTNSLPWL